MRGDRAVVEAVNLPNPGIEWQVLGTGNFDSDGDDDILWNHLDGALSIWSMENMMVSGMAGGTGTNSWFGATTHMTDTNGDRINEVLQTLCPRFSDCSSVAQNAFSFVPGTTDFASHTTSSAPTRVEAVANFTGDLSGKTSAVRRNVKTADMVLESNGVLTALGNVPTTWQVVGFGDFNGDGTHDLLWRHSGGTAAVWLFRNGVPFDTSFAPFVGNEWTLLGAADLDLNGKSDFLWWRPSDRMVVTWLNPHPTAGGRRDVVIGTTEPHWQFAGVLKVKTPIDRLAAPSEPSVSAAGTPTLNFKFRDNSNLETHFLAKADNGSIIATWTGQGGSGSLVTRPLDNLNPGQTVCVTITAWSDKTKSLSESTPSQRVCGRTEVRPTNPPPTNPVTDPTSMDYSLTGLIKLQKAGVSSSCGSVRFFFQNAQYQTILDELVEGETSGFDCVYKVTKSVKPGRYAVTVQNRGCTTVNVKSNATAQVLPNQNNCTFF